jgi:hypothetical protein
MYVLLLFLIAQDPMAGPMTIGRRTAKTMRIPGNDRSSRPVYSPGSWPESVAVTISIRTS